MAEVREHRLESSLQDHTSLPEFYPPALYTLLLRAPPTIRDPAAYHLYALHWDGVLKHYATFNILKRHKKKIIKHYVPIAQLKK